MAFWSSSDSCIDISTAVRYWMKILIFLKWLVNLHLRMAVLEGPGRAVLVGPLSPGRTPVMGHHIHLSVTEVCAAALPPAAAGGPSVSYLPRLTFRAAAAARRCLFTGPLGFLLTFFSLLITTSSNINVNIIITCILYKISVSLLISAYFQQALIWVYWPTPQSF